MANLLLLGDFLVNHIETFLCLFVLEMSYLRHQTATSRFQEKWWMGNTTVDPILDPWEREHLKLLRNTWNERELEIRHPIALVLFRLVRRIGAVDDLDTEWCTWTGTPSALLVDIHKDDWTVSQFWLARLCFNMLYTPRINNNGLTVSNPPLLSSTKVWDTQRNNVRVGIIISYYHMDSYRVS